LHLNTNPDHLWFVFFTVDMFMVNVFMCIYQHVFKHEYSDICRQIIVKLVYLSTVLASAHLLFAVNLTGCKCRDAELHFETECSSQWHYWLKMYKKAVLPQGNRAMPKLFYSV